MKNFCYQKKENWVHRLNPSAKLAWFLSVFILALVLDNPVYLLSIFFVTLWIALSGGIYHQWFTYMKFALWLSLLLVLLNALIAPYGETLLYESGFQIPLYGEIRITLESIVFGLSMSLRLLVVISLFALLSFTTSPDDILAILAKLRFPYKSVFLMSLTTRFIPTLTDDINRITDAQRSRGLDLDSGKLIKRLKNRTSILIPLLSNSLERSMEVGEAMEARAFGSSSKRTFYKVHVLGISGRVSVLLAISPLFFLSPIFLWGIGSYTYYPKLSPFLFGTLELMGLVILLSLLICLWVFAFLKK